MDNLFSFIELSIHIMNILFNLYCQCNILLYVDAHGNCKYDYYIIKCKVLSILYGKHIKHIKNKWHRTLN